MISGHYILRDRWRNLRDRFGPSKHLKKNTGRKGDRWNVDYQNGITELSQCPIPPDRALAISQIVLFNGSLSSPAIRGNWSIYMELTDRQVGNIQSLWQPLQQKLASMYWPPLFLGQSSSLGYAKCGLLMTGHLNDLNPCSGSLCKISPSNLLKRFCHTTNKLKKNPEQFYLVFHAFYTKQMPHKYYFTFLWRQLEKQY